MPDNEMVAVAHMGAAMRMVEGLRRTNEPKRVSGTGVIDGTIVEQYRDAAGTLYEYRQSNGGCSLYRLASQTPPATQPSATVGEVVPLAAAIDAITLRRENGGGSASYKMACDHAIDVLNSLATLHTPPPVATATVVDAGERFTPALHEGGRFREWSAVDLAAQCLAQAREQLDPEFSQFMTAVAERLSHTPTALDRVTLAQVIDPTAWRNIDGYMVEQVHSGEALRKADAVLALIAATPTPTAGER